MRRPESKFASLSRIGQEPRLIVVRLVGLIEDMIKVATGMIVVVTVETSKIEKVRKT